MKKLGFGLMRLPCLDPNDPTSIDREAARRMVDRYMAAGFTYFDTAYVYHGGKSEEVFGELVAARYPREAFTVTTKMPVFRLEKAEDYGPVFDEQLRRCRVDYFDYYFLHALDRKRYARVQEQGGFEFMAEQKALGRIRHAGFSFHDDAETLELILKEHPETELVQLQINYLDWDSDKVQARKCYELCRRYGVEVAVMEPLKGGALVRLPENAAGILRA